MPGLRQGVFQICGFHYALCIVHYALLFEEVSVARRFRFNLDPVLRYRQIMEDQKRREFAEANRVLEEERMRREEIQRERSDMQDEIVQSFQDQAPFQSIVSSYHMVGRLEHAIVVSRRRELALEQEK